MRWTPLLEEYLSTISRSRECPTDEIFSLQIRLQVLAQQVCEQRDQRDLDRCQVASNTASSGSTEPLLNRWYLEGLQRKLHEITASIPLHLKENGKLPFILNVVRKTTNICSYRDPPVPAALHLFKYIRNHPSCESGCHANLAFT
jgi:hypothetical protein